MYKSLPPNTQGLNLQWHGNMQVWIPGLYLNRCSVQRSSFPLHVERGIITGLLPRWLVPHNGIRWYWHKIFQDLPDTSQLRYINCRGGRWAERGRRRPRGHMESAPARPFPGTSADTPHPCHVPPTLRVGWGWGGVPRREYKIAEDRWCTFVLVLFRNLTHLLFRRVLVSCFLPLDPCFLFLPQALATYPIPPSTPPILLLSFRTSAHPTTTPAPE